MILYVYLCIVTFKKRIVMKTEEKTSMCVVAQVIFRPSAERRGHYLLYYGHLAPDGTFVEDFRGSLPEFLDDAGVSPELVTAFVEAFSDSELEISDFGYLSQERFDSFMHFFVHSSDGVQLYPGMMVMSFNKKEDED